MSGNERVRGIQVHRPIIYGSQARLLTDEERATAPPGHTHKWTIFLTSAATPPPTKSAQSSTDAPPVDPDYIPGGEDDLSYLIKRVVFRLHETYPSPNRMCEKPPYKVTVTGWGEFMVPIKVTFVPEAAEKALSLQHFIKLHHWGEPIEPIEPAPGIGEASDATPAETPAEGGGEEAKPETQTPKVEAPAEASQAPTETSATEAPSAEGTADATPAAENGDGNDPAMAPLPLFPPSSAFPVHAWQYDEIVFSDPPANFLSVLEANPPTPLPARPRRPRDQREEHETRTGKKRTKTGTNTRPVSRAGTEALEGITTRAGTPATPGAGQLAFGAGGELGSADVPLEFSTDMEKAEHARLTDVRVKIVHEMDRWREKLIAQEKELAKLKEDMRSAAAAS